MINNRFNVVYHLLGLVKLLFYKLKKIIMEFTIKCIKEYKTYNDLVLFECGKNYKLVIQDDSAAIVMYDEKNGTKFIGGLSKYFSKK